jgi:selenoprotein W-related protein
MTHVEIEYCVPCGFRHKALQLSEAILAALETDIDELTLRTGSHGTFRVSVDDEVVYDSADEAFDVDDTVRDVRQAL